MISTSDRSEGRCSRSYFVFRREGGLILMTGSDKSITVPIYDQVPSILKDDNHSLIRNRLKGSAQAARACPDDLPESGKVSPLVNSIKDDSVKADQI